MTEAEKRRDARLRKVYGISLEEYNLVLKAQAGVCYLCKRAPSNRSLSVDHNHQDPFEVRGLLCHRCNKFVVGSLDVSMAWAVYQYLSNPPATAVFGYPRRVPIGMEKGQRRRRRKVVKRDLRKK